MTAHACRVDRSRETGSIVACTCGFAVGPFTDRARAHETARDHREAHASPLLMTPRNTLHRKKK